jgi:phospholipid-translocating ATPase
MSFFKRHTHPDDVHPDEEHDPNIDPELRLRTVRTAASTIAESILSEARAQRRKSLRRKGSRFFRHKGADKKRPRTADSTASGSRLEVQGERRNIYVNHSLTAMEVDRYGEPLVRYVRNKVRTSSEWTEFYSCVGRLVGGGLIYV